MQVADERAAHFRSILLNEVVGSADEAKVPRFNTRFRGRYGSEQPCRLFISEEGITMADPDDDSKLHFFHGFTYIRSFIKPKHMTCVSGYVLSLIHI